MSACGDEQELRYFLSFQAIPMKFSASILRFSTLFITFLPCLSKAQTVGDLNGGWSIRGTNPIMIFHGGNHVTSYHSGVEAGKPYFYPVVGPTGENMTRHWPMKEGFEDEADDHVHHRGMWSTIF